ncbi:MAG: hypothetical protein ACLFPJ_04060 [Candidatus Woesearchaeota archaeon]
MKKMLVLVLVMALFCASFVMADAREAETTVGTSGTLDETDTAGDAEAEGGNVTNVDLDGTYSTQRWQGFYGDVSATLQLGLATDVFYDFGTVGVEAVYATQNQAFNFAGATNVDDVTGLDTAWGYTDGDDQIVDVYTETISNDGYTDALGVNPRTSDFNSYAIGTAANPASKDDVAFGATVENAGATGFDGGTYNYELMLPADGIETYYFYMSI